MPKIVAISDTHALHRKMETVPDGDILIHAGDLTNKGEAKDIISFNSWLGSLPHQHKIVIAGNHDFYFENYPENARKLITNGIYLQDQSVEIMGLKIYGSPWQPWFFDWAFNLRRGPEIAAAWERIPDNTDILVTHGPPDGILDRTATGQYVGCKDLLARIKKLSIKAHIFGHIHEAYGKLKIDGVQFVNASICTLAYQPTNVPIVFEVG